MSAGEVVIEAEGVVTRFGKQTVHDGLSLQVKRGELVALIGGSGSGKSVLLREILGLQRPNAGSVRLLGTDMWNSGEEALAATRKRFGMMFQEGALFSSLDVAGNVATPLLEHTDTPPELSPRLVNLRLTLAGLSAEEQAAIAEFEACRHEESLDELVKLVRFAIAVRVFAHEHVVVGLFARFDLRITHRAGHPKATALIPTHLDRLHDAVGLAGEKIYRKTTCLIATKCRIMLQTIT